MIGKLFDALKAGQELSNPAVWKNRQTAANLLVVVLSGLSYLASKIWGVTIPDEVVANFAEFIAFLLGLINIYFTYATSKKVGL